MKGSIFKRMGWGGAAAGGQAEPEWGARQWDAPEWDAPQWDADAPANRRYRRWATDFEAFIDVGGQSYACRVSDVSPGGVRVRLMDAAGIAVGTELLFDLDGWGQIPAVVRHSAYDVLGLEFLLVEGEEIGLARWLVANKPERRQPRHACDIQAELRWAGEVKTCRVTDISRTGARVELAHLDDLVNASEVSLALPDEAPIPATVRYVDDAGAGLNFHYVYEGTLPA